uniref:Uncharacterized protein n=1 Tax=uncultured bacterium CSL11 TaxID=1091566 RepID=G4WVE4_9BACT|nr:hypothetical protein [uncultured bacterium CSL11]
MSRLGRLALCLFASVAISQACFGGGLNVQADNAASISQNMSASRFGESPVRGAARWDLAQAAPTSGQGKPIEPKPGSKDELFGVTPADAPKPGTKDELFGATAPGPDSGARVGGFIEGLGAYTYSDPVHWSRGVGRLQLTAQGEFPEKVKWKLGARLDADVVYFTSDFYLDSVKRNQRANAFWGENYIDFAVGSLDFRLGAQQIIWGEVVGLFFADVVSARDTREFLLPSFDIIRIPQWAARAEYFAGDSHVEVIWIPIPAFDRIGKPGADFYPAPLPSPTSQQQAAFFTDPVTPSRNLGNSNWGIRANTLLSGWDVAGFYYRSLSTSPTFYRAPTGTPSQPFVFQPQYDRIWQAGATVTKDFGEVVVRGEAVYTDGRGYSVTSLATPQGVVFRPTLDYILSAEFAPGPDTRVNIQGFQRVYYRGGDDDLVIKSGGFGASVLLSTKLTSAFEPEILWIQTFDNGGGLIRPRLNWYAAKNATFGFGVDIFTGPSDGYFGRYNNRDRVYSELRVNF